MQHHYFHVMYHCLVGLERTFALLKLVNKNACYKGFFCDQGNGWQLRFLWNYSTKLELVAKNIVNLN